MSTSPRNNIPSPRGLPIIGNILELDDELPISSMERLCDVYGPIVRLNIMGQDYILVGSVELLEEVCDEKRFAKGLADGFEPPPNGDPKGLFSAENEDDMDWQIAHRVLMPVLGPLSIVETFPEMHDIASQLVLKWARLGPSHRIAATNDFIKLTLDTIGLCAMDYRFNSFYQDGDHPFVQSVNKALAAASERTKPSIKLKRWIPWDKTGQTAPEHTQYIQKVAMELVNNRRQSPTDKADILNAMVTGKDTKSGQSMSDGLILTNMLTLLIAGHETTAGLLSFAFLQLLKHPGTYFKAQQEIDEVVGDRMLTIEHLKDLKYVNAVLRETLRLFPPAPSFNRKVRPREDNPNRVELISDGKYELREDDKIVCVISRTQRDPTAYGEDANEFNPERMLEENFARLPNAAWKPFGNGIRACIGRSFALQEAVITMTLILQTFNLRLDDPAYEMKIRQAITIRPEGFFMRASVRKGINVQALQGTLFSSSVPAIETEAVGESLQHDMQGLEPMTILYGSNTGTCRSLAERLSIQARRYGRIANVMDMDGAVEHIPVDQPIAIITSSYEGQPPDNANQFVAWLEALKEPLFDNVKYSLFGCGHSDWAQTYQRIPKLVDALVSQHGGTRFASLGFADASKGGIFGAFDSWADEAFWQAIATGDNNAESRAPYLDVEISSQDRTSYLREDVKPGTVLATRRLTTPGEPVKMHLKLKLPEGMTYETGDYLAILPTNPDEQIAKVMHRFRLPRDATITIKHGTATFLPTGISLPVIELLKGFVELNYPATKTDIQACIDVCNTSVKAELEALIKGDTHVLLVEQRVSILDLLTKFPSMDLPFGTFLALLPPLRPRYYSISSSALADPRTCSITYGVLREEAKSGIGQFVGVAGTYLSSLKESDTVLVCVRTGNKHFRLPADQSKTPILMFGAGTGLAPFRAFIEERVVQLAAGKPIAPALMIMGCRSSTDDRLHAEEMDEWAAMGAVDIRYAFSREPEKSEGCKYIQDRFLKDRKDLQRMWQEGAKVYTCCSPAVAASLGQAAKRLLIETAREENGLEISEEEAAAWFAERRNDRVVADVFA